MQNLIFFTFLLLVLVSCKTGAGGSAAPEGMGKAVTELRSRYAPDRRTDRVEVNIQAVNGALVLSGYTTVAPVVRSLDSLARSTPGTRNTVRLLPTGALQDSYGLIRTSVANIRTEPGHSQELTSQALLGTPLALLDEQDGWYLIRTPDRYLAWLEEGAFTRVDRAGLEAWFSPSLRTCVPAQTVVLVAPDDNRVVSELVAGSLVQQTGARRGDYVEVRLPDDRRGFVRESELRPFAQLASPEGVRMDSVLRTAFAQVGRPYLWGGTSPKAMDCSGFTKTAYYLNGYVIPRDASQQVHAGVDVPLNAGFAELQRGDLLFFGSYRDDGSERVTHVGFYLGKGRFLHAGADNDYVTENSLLEKDADFAPHRRESLLRARRLGDGAEGVVPVGEAFRALYTKSSSR